MRRSIGTYWMLSVLAACTVPAVGGQTPPPGPGGAERPNIYEVPVPHVPAHGQESGFIEVSGHAVIEVDVDRASVSFAVETRSETANSAAEANANLMAEVIRAVRAGGFAGLDLETFGYSLRPEYRSGDNRARTIDGYTSLNNVRATISDVDAVGGVIDAAIGAGANRVASLSFSATDTDEARRRALAEAVGTARRQAEVIAASLGYSLGPPLEIRGGAQSPTPRSGLIVSASPFTPSK